MTDEKPWIKPEEYRLVDPDGKEVVYILSNFDAVAGRHIVSQYPMTCIPQFGDYLENQKLMFKLMGYVGVITGDGRRLRLETEALVNNHVPHFEMLLKIEAAMMEKNCSFFQDGRGASFFENLVQIITKKALEILTPSSQQSSEPEKQPLTN